MRKPAVALRKMGKLENSDSLLANTALAKESNGSR
jgi:hypothetical protein